MINVFTIICMCLRYSKRNGLLIGSKRIDISLIEAVFISRVDIRKNVNKVLGFKVSHQNGYLQTCIFFIIHYFINSFCGSHCNKKPIRFTYRVRFSSIHIL